MSMRLALPRSLVLGVGVVALLLAMLATLQYRWLGQISEADQARLRATARNRALEFAREFDREITRAFLRLRFDAAGARSLDATGFLERQARWRASTSHPGLVQDVWLVDEPSRSLWRLDPRTNRLVPSPWPATLLPMRERIREAPRSFASARTFGAGAPPAGAPPFFRSPRPGPADFLDAENLALVSPILDFEAPPATRTGSSVTFQAVALRLAGYTIVTLDRAYLRGHLFGALSRRHFSAGAEDEYALLVTAAADPRQVVFRSAPVGAAPGPGDATVLLFGLRMEEAGEGDLAAFQGARVASASRRLGPEPSSRERPENVAFSAGRRVSRFSRGEPDGAWRLVATHRAGSVDQVVAAARLRNLGVSAGILALLGVSVVLIVVSAQRARRLAERQLEFVAGVSHELRTPVAVIASAGENLADGIVSDPKTVKRYGRVVRDEARRLAEMVEQVLDFAGSYAGRRAYRFKEVDLESLARECLGALRPAIEEAGASVLASIEPGLPRVRADRAALRRAVLNLLQNAVKYGGPSPKVGFRITGPRGHGRGEVRIAVEDHGLGIAPAERERIFEPFVRGEEAQARQIRGSGLGLSLVNRIVEAHSGRITLTSTPGQGSTFVVSLPASFAGPEDSLLAQEGVRGTAHPAG